MIGLEEKTESIFKICVSSLLGIGDAMAGSCDDMNEVFVKVSNFNLVYFKTSSCKTERILSITVFCWLLFSIDIQEHNWLISWLNFMAVFESFFGGWGWGCCCG